MFIYRKWPIFVEASEILTFIYFRCPVPSFLIHRRALDVATTQMPGSSNLMNRFPQSM